MPIIIEQGLTASTIKLTNYENKAELQQLIAENPQLLMADNEPENKLIQREVSLGDAGVLDLLFVDSMGKLTAVEVKFSGNSESRRTVAWQVFDYVSALSLYTVDEIDELVNGKLEEALRQFTNHNSAEEFERRWQFCGSTLRAGQVRFVIAVDAAPEDLIRIVRYINEHSDLDVRLTEIHKFIGENNEIILAPNLLVHGGNDINPIKTTKPASEKFKAIAAAYEQIAPHGFPIRNNDSRSRIIHPDHWPLHVHYEFLDNRNENITVDIHLEGNNVRTLSSIIFTISNTFKPKIDGTKVEWHPEWSQRRGGMRVVFAPDTSPLAMAETMKQLIEETNSLISNEIIKLGVC